MTFADPSGVLAVFGRAHPLLLHAPFGMLPALALLEFGNGVLRWQVPRAAIVALAWLTAACAGTAAAAGLVLAGEGGYPEALVGSHKLLGIGFAALCTLAALASHAARRAPLRVLLVAALAAMVPTGHLGGSLTHGENFLLQPLQPPPATKPATPPAAEQSPFTRSVLPILERTCGKCHDPDKHKGKLVLTTREGITRGGKNGAVIVAGKPDESPLLQRCELPLEDDDRMPPSDEPQPSALELAVLRFWIAAGAPF